MGSIPSISCWDFEKVNITSSSKRSWIKALSEAILSLSGVRLKLHVKLKIIPLRSYGEASSAAILALSGVRLKLHVKLKLTLYVAMKKLRAKLTVSSFNQELASYAKLAHLGSGEVRT